MWRQVPWGDTARLHIRQAGGRVPEPSPRGAAFRAPGPGFWERSRIGPQRPSWLVLLRSGLWSPRWLVWKELHLLKPELLCHFAFPLGGDFCPMKNSSAFPLVMS